MSNIFLRLEEAYPHYMGISYGLLQAFTYGLEGPLVKYLKDYPLYQLLFV